MARLTTNEIPRKPDPNWKSQGRLDESSAEVGTELATSVVSISSSCPRASKGTTLIQGLGPREQTLPLPRARRESPNGDNLSVFLYLYFGIGFNRIAERQPRNKDKTIRNDQYINGDPNRFVYTISESHIHGKMTHPSFLLLRGNSDRNESFLDDPGTTTIS